MVVNQNTQEALGYSHCLGTKPVFCIAALRTELGFLLALPPLTKPCLGLGTFILLKSSSQHSLCCISDAPKCVNYRQLMQHWHIHRYHVHTLVNLVFCQILPFPVTHNSVFYTQVGHFCLRHQSFLCKPGSGDVCLAVSF